MMASKDEVFDYVMETPGNTNPSVLRSLLNNLEDGGGESEIVDNAVENRGIGHIEDQPEAITWDGSVDETVIEPDPGYRYKRIGDDVDVATLYGTKLKIRVNGLTYDTDYAETTVQPYKFGTTEVLCNVTETTVVTDVTLPEGLYVFNAEMVTNKADSRIVAVTVSGEEIPVGPCDVTQVISIGGFPLVRVGDHITIDPTHDIVGCRIDLTGSDCLVAGDFYAEYDDTGDTPVLLYEDYTGFGLTAILNQHVESGETEPGLYIGAMGQEIEGVFYGAWVDEIQLAGTVNKIDPQFVDNSPFVVTLYNVDTGTNIYSDHTLFAILSQVQLHGRQLILRAILDGADEEYQTWQYFQVDILQWEPDGLTYLQAHSTYVSNSALVCDLLYCEPSRFGGETWTLTTKTITTT